MIRRNDGDSFLLISQVAHARLSGEMARKLGNAIFAPPSPFEEVVFAIDRHDEGWEGLDRHPTINERGWPRHVFETDIHDPSIFRVWEESVESAATGGDYAGLLVSLHVLGLSAQAVAKRSDLRDESMRAVLFRVNQFQHKQIEKQEEFRRALGMRTDWPLRLGLAELGRSVEEDLLLRNFWTLQLLDRLSLVLCFGEMIFAGVEPVYAKAGEAGMAVKFLMDKARGVRVTPWVFEGDDLRFEISARRVQATVYKTKEELWGEMEAAKEEVVRVRIFR